MNNIIKFDGNTLYKVIKILLFSLVLIFLYYSSKVNYLLFHTISEGFSIIISFMIFLIAYLAKENTDEPNLTFLGLSYLSIGIIDLLHTLSYKGMAIFTDYQFYANQLWIVARYMESLSLLVFVFLYYLNIKKINLLLVSVIYFIITILSILSIYYWKIFPICFVENHGQTLFKIISEYIIIGILLLSSILFLLKKNHIVKHLFYNILLSIIATIISEFCFTLYISNYGTPNFIGHIFKIISFYYIYKSIVVIGIKEPYNLLYNKLKANEQRLIELNNTKDKFFSIIGHDLKNPFFSIMAVSNLLLENYDTMENEQKKEFVNLINKSANSSFKLLENLLYWARLQTGKIDYNLMNLDINEIITETINFLNNMAKLKNISIIYNNGNSLFVTADKDMLSLLIRNLLSNAIKFTKEYGKIEINVNNKIDNVTVSIKDNGVGMSSEILNKIFKIDSNISMKGTNNEEGTGLGLILCKEFIEKHNGKIWVESEKDKGSNFIFSIPKTKM
ncbi:MAG: hypothetical protein A2086_10435 [Spirochaetes bacterium GWD1_27_9]|nr:MAG: hypothetical protein A2Z98_16220 [Spirochaetes bacterium GWB1_27_13]OHD22908.1 MAG: hypothetical protein A2Y34_00720 [Spirochaetes bacterium GWC1_27_15]OHD43143.1 MAG: hypothetical protein A2086_10435 [Spirochaetes bacterium GWD1_27_9]